MRGRIYTCDHRIYDLPELLSWRVVQTGGVPCDCYRVQFLYQPEMAEVLHLAGGFLGMEGGRAVARGIVDDYTVELGSGGTVVTLTGRGLAARLLDNESRPATYQAATLREIIRCHVTPYGVHTRAAADLRADSVYTVPAGVSQWKALSDFCRTYGGFLPRFTVHGELLAVPEKRPERTRVIDGKSPVLRCSLREDRYGVLTEALVIDKKRNASFSVRNEEMLRLGGQCRRVIYTPGQSTWDRMRYTGQYQIEKSREEEKRVQVTLPGSFPAFPGDRIHVQLERIGVRGTFRVQETENLFSAERGAEATLTLKECE